MWKDIKAEKYSRRSTARDFPSAAVPQGFQVQPNRCVWLCGKVIVFQLHVENDQIKHVLVEVKVKGVSFNKLSLRGEEIV